MNAFNQLCEHAREKRDKAIRIAKADYQRTLLRIADLEQELEGAVAPTHRTASACIDAVMPKDREFTIDDIMSGLQALAPKRTWRRRTVDSYLYRLREKNIVRRRRKHSKSRPAVYVLTNIEVEPLPFEDMTLGEAVAVVVAGADRELTQTEIVVKLLESGYQTDMEPKYLRNAVGQARHS